jgi:hypothetical protein
MTVQNTLGQDLRPQYDPNRLLDTLIEKLQVRNDAGLARAIAVERSVIGNVRCGKLSVGGIMLLRMHTVSKVSIKDLRDLMGDRRGRFRMNSASFEPIERRRDSDSS